MANQRTPRTATEIERWLAALVGDLLGIDAEAIDVTKRFDRYGLDSSAAIGVTAALEKYLERDLEPTLLYDFTTIQRLAQHLAGLASEG